MDRLTAEGVRAALGEAGRSILPQVEDCVGSTNSLLREAARQGAPEGTALIAGSQSAGRGRLGRSFYSPEGTGLYMSLLLRPTLAPQASVLLTAAAAAAVCDAISRLTGREAGIKWVNDIFLDGRKICGILTEAAFDATGGSLAWAVLGIGVNVYAPAEGFPPALADIAGALTDTERPGLRSELAGRILGGFWRYYQALEQRTFLPVYRQRSIVIGRDVLLQAAGRPDVPAHALAIDDDCRLVVRLANGSTRAVSTGEISLRLAAQPSHEKE